MSSHKPLLKNETAITSAAIDPTGILNRAVIERVGVEAVKAALKSIQEVLENRAREIAEKNHDVKIKAKSAPDANIAPTTPRLK